MSSREPDNSQLRDTLLAKLMAESLASSSAALGANCPDAETIAAYAERNLSPEETARLDIHFADCGHCQTLLAALARSLDSLPADGATQSPAEIPFPTLANIPPRSIARPAKSPISARDATQSSTSASKIRPVIKTVPPPQPTRWSELAPALGVAAAIALWFALRPAPATQNLSAQLRTETETSATQQTEPAPALTNPGIADANIPAPPAPPPATPTRMAPASASQSQESQQLSADALKSDTSQESALKKSGPAEETANSPAAVFGAAATDIATQKELRASQAQPAASTPASSALNGAAAQTFSTGLRAPLAAAPPKSAAPQVPGARIGGAAPAAPIAPAAERAKPAVAIDTLTNRATVTVTGDLPTLNIATAQLGGTLQPAVGELPVQLRNYSYLLPTAPEQIGLARELRAALSAPVSLDEATAKSSGLGIGRVSGIASVPPTARPLVLTRMASTASTFASPSGNKLWRIGASGSIERSSDRSRTWQRQSSGVTGDLLSGAAASDETAWIVGRGGIILRTTDGKTWQRISLPPAFTANASLDFSAVQTSDALHAMVTATSGRRFITSDGGQTWTSQ